MATATPEGALPALPLEEWEQTKDTLHLYSQVVGKVRLASTWPRNHWSVLAFLHLALNRFSARRASLPAGVDPVTREVYSHEVISFGFWAGSEQVREPAFYSYTAPEREGLRDEPLTPDAAHWVDTGNGSLALLRYDDLRTTADPRGALLGFFESACGAGVRTSDWPGDELTAARERPGTHGNRR